MASKAQSTKVPTAEELQKRADAESSAVGTQAEAAASETSVTEPAPAAPIVLSPPESRMRVRVEQTFYWRQGPGLVAVPVPAGTEMEHPVGMVEDMVAQGARLIFLDASLRARAIALLETLDHGRDPAPFAEEIAAVEAQLRELVAKIKAFHAGRGG